MKRVPWGIIIFTRKNIVRTAASFYVYKNNDLNRVLCFFVLC
jgi:hypothetical protein